MKFGAVLYFAHCLAWMKSCGYIIYSGVESPFDEVSVGGFSTLLFMGILSLLDTCRLCKM